jgi:prophage regulatory protein
MLNASNTNLCSADPVLVELYSRRLLRLREVLLLIPISQSSWYAGIKEGRYPAPVALGGSVAWRAGDIADILENGAYTYKNAEQLLH